jgi:hypothetical protein
MISKVKYDRVSLNFKEFSKLEKRRETQAGSK